MVTFNNFIHGDLHKKNWKVRINDDGEYKIILYDFGLCWKLFDPSIINIMETVVNGFHNSDYDKPTESGKWENYEWCDVVSPEHILHTDIHNRILETKSENNFFNWEK